jgi:transcriptional/translational regulatory protein YebC/TACO1
MAHNPENKGCPYCRSTIIERPATDDDDDDSEWEEGSEEDDEEERNIVVEKGNVEEVVARLEKAGVTMLDVVSLLINRFSNTDPKYTMDHIENLCNMVDDISDDVENEPRELEDMAAEDVRA